MPEAGVKAGRVGLCSSHLQLGRRDDFDFNLQNTMIHNNMRLLDWIHADHWHTGGAQSE
jgi:hypothetical protein